MEPKTASHFHIYSLLKLLQIIFSHSLGSFILMGSLFSLQAARQIFITAFLLVETESESHTRFRMVELPLSFRLFASTIFFKQLSYLLCKSSYLATNFLIICLVGSSAFFKSLIISFSSILASRIGFVGFVGVSLQLCLASFSSAIALHRNLVIFLVWRPTFALHRRFKNCVALCVSDDMGFESICSVMSSSWRPLLKATSAQQNITTDKQRIACYYVLNRKAHCHILKNNPGIGIP